MLRLLSPLDRYGIAEKLHTYPLFRRELLTGAVLHGELLPTSECQNGATVRTEESAREDACSNPGWRRLVLDAQLFRAHEGGHLKLAREARPGETGKCVGRSWKHRKCLAQHLHRAIDQKPWETV